MLFRSIVKDAVPIVTDASAALRDDPVTGLEVITGGEDKA